MTQANEIKTKLEEMTQFIAEAHAKLQKGEVVNLAHLDAEIATLCEQTLTLPTTEAQKIQPIMGNMISHLEELGVALQDFQTQLKDNNGL